MRRTNRTAGLSRYRPDSAPAITGEHTNHREQHPHVPAGHHRTHSPTRTTINARNNAIRSPGHHSNLPTPNLPYA
jgi:hypothetical protein